MGDTRLRRAIWRTRRALKRERHLTRTKDSAETEKAHMQTQSKHFNWSSIAKQENPKKVSHKLLPRPLLNLCRRAALISSKKSETVLSRLKYGKGSPEDVLKERAVGLSGKIGKSAVGDVET